MSNARAACSCGFTSRRFPDQTVEWAIREIKRGMPEGDQNDTMSFRNWTIAAVHGDVHIDGESGTIDDTEQHVARVRAAIDRAKEQQTAARVGFRALLHAGALAAHDHEKNQRTEH